MKMTRIKKFDEFLLEWNILRHWAGERASLTDSLSRIQPKSEKFPDGWICEALEEVDENGKATGKSISKMDFLKKFNFTEEDFDQKLTASLYYLLNGDGVKRKSYKPRTHIYVRIGKIAFTFEDKFYAPTYTTSYVKRGATIWGDVKDNIGATVLFLQDGITPEEIKKKADAHRLKGYENMTTEEYMNTIFSIGELFDKNFMLIVPPTTDWKELVERQANTGVKWKPSRDYSMDADTVEWKKLLIPDAVTTFDVGDEVYSGGKIKKVVQIDQNKNIIYFDDKTMKMLKPESTLDIVSRDPKGPVIREIGKLPTDGTLVKSIRFNSYRKTSTKKIGLAGPILSYFVVLPDGERVNSPL